MNENIITEGFLNKVFKKPETNKPNTNTNEDKLAKMREMIDKQNKVNNNVDKTLNSVNSKFGLKKETSLQDAMDYIDNALTEATHRLNGRTIRGNSLRTSFAAKDEIENRENKALGEFDIPKASKLANVSDASNDEMIKLFDDKYSNALKKIKELSKSNDPKDKEELRKAREEVKKINDERKEKMISLRNKAKEISDEPHSLSALIN